MAMQNNANAASAFGLLAPTDVMASMPTPTTYANGMKGYGSIGLYDQALAELTASNPENMAAYNNLFGNQVAPINFGRQGGGGGGGFRGGANPTHNPTTPQVHTTSGWKDPAAAAKIMDDLNVTRGKLTDPNMAAYQATQSGEAQGQLRHQIQQNYKDQKEGRAKGSMASGKNYRMTYNPKTGRGGF